MGKYRIFYKFVFFAGFLFCVIYFGNKYGIRSLEDDRNTISERFLSEDSVIVIHKYGVLLDAEFILNEAYKNGYRLVSHVVANGSKDGMREEIFTFQIIEKEL